jgi:potassium channel subfamily K, other eukaryote
LSRLIAVNAVSLVLALIANAALLLNMARRVPFQIAQPITILGFWIASVLLIGLIAYAASSHSFHKGIKNQALTQAYYYAIFAAGLYQIISYLMCVTVYGAYKGHYSKEFKLTVAQRTLMLQTISFLVYLLLGALVYSHIEGWKFLDAVYWADFTSLTIGIGASYVPTTHLGRGLLFPFAMGGIIILGLVVGSIRSLILERGKKKLASRLTEKTRVRLLKEIQRISQRKSLLRRKGAMGLSKDHTKVLTADPGEGQISELERRQAEFEAMRKVQDWAHTQRKYMSLGVSTFAFAFLASSAINSVTIWAD